MLLKTFYQNCKLFSCLEFAHEETLSEFISFSCLEHAYQETLFEFMTLLVVTVWNTFITQKCIMLQWGPHFHWWLKWPQQTWQTPHNNTCIPGCTEWLHLIWPAGQKRETNDIVIWNSVSVYIYSGHQLYWR